MLDAAQYHIAGATAREIAASVESGIRSGSLGGGDALPTVRALAERLGTSPATVSSAYRTLRGRGLTVADGRRGTRVAPRPSVRGPEPRPQPLDGSAGAGHALRDLASGLPDPALLLSLDAALRHVDVERTIAMNRLDRPDPGLLALGAEAFAADGIIGDALAVVAGAFDGIERVLETHLRPGDRVIVEDPAYTSTLDLLLALGLEAVPVPVDESGLVPDRLAGALAGGAQALVLVPRAQNPYGAALDGQRATALRELLADHPELLLIEDDHAGAVAGAPYRTLTSGRRRWAVIRSVSKTLHPDLRLALAAGDATTIGRVEGRQALGPRWVSHLLQATVVALLRDPGYPGAVQGAAAAYGARRRALIDALAAHGVPAHGRSGLNVWVPVREEAPVLRALYARGWVVGPGERFRLATPPGVRVTVATLREGEAEAIAATIAEVERGGGPPRLY